MFLHTGHISLLLSCVIFLLKFIGTFWITFLNLWYSCLLHSHYTSFWCSWQNSWLIHWDSIWCVSPTHHVLRPVQFSSLLAACCPQFQYAVILRLRVSARWRRWMPAACNWLRSLWLVSTQRCSSMTCVASRYHGNTAVLGAFSMENFFRANWPGLPATGPPCWTCVRGRYELCVEMVWKEEIN